MMMTFAGAIGIFLAGALTLAIFSFLYKDNPVYKFAEHLFIGTSAGYWFVYNVYNVFWPNVIVAWGEAEGFWAYFNIVMPVLLGVFMLMRLIPSIAWISRWAMAFSVGMSVGFSIIMELQTNILQQIGATLSPFASLHFNNGGTAAAVNAIIILLAVLSALVYFFFSKEHTGAYGHVAKVGIWVLMITFGASFGYTVMARISLLIGRVQFLQEEWWVAIKHLIGLGS
ncbi:MAG TPA: hypothetical protein ENN72_04195 [Firmicutes bacterium]|nr:hypothetical protein [Bacillota bacterium]